MSRRDAGAGDDQNEPQNCEATVSQRLPRMLTPLRPLPPVYGGAAPTYLASGLGSPLPLKPWRKAPPPTGFTGKDGKTPTQRRIERWAKAKPRHNLALRLAPGVLGLDVDCYGGRVGAQTLALGQERWGPLPATVRSSSRLDGISGIYLYRVPPDVQWPSVLTADLSWGGPPGNIELVHYGLRYAVCWPSIHPNGRPYLWWNEAGPLDEVPNLANLPYLPQGWVQGLSGLVKPAAALRPASAEVETPAHAWPVAPVTVQEQANRVASTPEGSRNEVLNEAAYWLAGDLTVEEKQAEQALVAAGKKAGLSARQARATFLSGWTAGRKKPYR